LLKLISDELALRPRKQTTARSEAKNALNISGRRLFGLGVQS
jgi:hypothetical protein